MQRERKVRMKLLKSLLVVGLVGMGTGCATTKQLVPLPDQSRKTLDANKARIYVMRRTGMQSAAIPATVWDGSKKVGSTGPSGYLCWDRVPGNVLIQVDWSGTVSTTMRLNCKQGQTYYVIHRFKMGFWTSFRGSSLTLMSQSEGSKELAKCKAPKVQ